MTFNLSQLLVIFFGLLAMLFCLALEQIGWGRYLLSIAIAVNLIVTNGHVHLTTLRILFDKKNQKTMSFAIILLIYSFLLGLSWYSIKMVLLFYFYMDLVHNMRQHHGFGKLFSLQTDHPPFIYRLFCLLMFLPLISMHIRPEPLKFFYRISYKDLYHYPSQWLHTTLMVTGLSILIVILWHLIKKPNKALMYMLANGCVYFFVGFVLENVPLALISLSLAHGVPYFVIMNDYFNKNQKWKYLIGICAFGIIAGTSFSLFRENFAPRGNFHGLAPYLIAFLLLPGITHFIFDAFLWKRSNQESLDYLKRSTIFNS